MSAPLFRLTTNDYTVSDWLSLHGFDVAAVKETILNIEIPHTPTSLDDTKCPLQLSAEEAWELASQAIADALPTLSGDIEFVRDNCEKVFDAPEVEQPHALDRGAKQVPFVSLCYQGTPADVLCVAHEFGHALQYHLVSDRFVPPVWREFAAFVAEKMLLGFIQKNRPDLYAPLYAAWRKNSTIYFGKDTKQLQDAMCAPTAPYIYRINYPIARHLADQIFDASADYDLTKIFQGKFSHSELLSTLQDQNGSHEEDNYLPEVPEAETDRSAINAYRYLGMMSLLDIDYWQGESEKTIKEYYSTRLAHMQSQTALVGIGKERKPIGYAIWDAGKDDASIIRLKRQAAPFGDHLELQQILQRRLPENARVLSHHARSARQEQIAW